MHKSTSRSQQRGLRKLARAGDLTRETAVAFDILSATLARLAASEDSVSKLNDRPALERVMQNQAGIIR